MISISFVIPAYNEEQHIYDCVIAIDNEMWNHITTTLPTKYQIIVVDNNSNDKTSQRANAAGANYIHEPRQGVMWARQTGLDNATCDLVAFIDADNILTKGWAKKVIDYFENDPALVAVAGPYRWESPMLLKYGGPIFFPIMKLISKVTPTMMFGNFVAKRQALIDMGGLDTSIEFYGDDTATAISISKMGKFKVALDIPVVSSPRRFIEKGFIYTLYKYWVTGFLGVYLKHFSSSFSQTK